MVQYVNWLLFFLHIFFTSKLDDDLKYRNNIQNIFDEFKIQLFSIFCYL